VNSVTELLDELNQLPLHIEACVIRAYGNLHFANL